MAFPIPASYGEWRHCITEVCGLVLTEAFIHQRLAALENPDDYMTRKFIALYGETHRRQTRAWFARALDELAESPTRNRR
ncbi:hypothetical protein [Alcanivorax jadensis]|uniref:hypothetical protein n=1 Tax=Alcanivorax jadensis TaxID=64988 RepID=UPI0026EA59BF|nr:hypothetical protein [Alcanivorax jadensis]